MNNYGQNYYNRPMQYPMYGQPMQGMQGVPQMQSQMQQPMQQQPIQQPIQQIGLQGKSVDSVEVVKAMDIPLDGSISYFPLADGTAIVTKQLQMDGTSKTIVFKPIDQEEPVKLPKYVTEEEFKEAMKKTDITSLKNELRDEVKELKRQIKNLNEDFKEEIKNRKD